MTDPTCVPVYSRSQFTEMPSGRLVAELTDLPQWQRIPGAIAMDGVVFHQVDTFRDSDGYIVGWLFTSTTPGGRASAVIFSDMA